MSRLKGICGFFRSIYQRNYSQAIFLSTANEASTLSNRYIVRAFSASGHTNVNTSSVVASGEVKGTGEPNLSDPTKRAVRGGPVSWLSFLLLIATGTGITVYYDKEKKRHIEELKTVSSATKDGASVGTAAIGGPFNLVNHDGKSVTQRDFVGQWTLIYFGFTHCPDICPDELQKLAAAVDKIKGKAGIDIVPVFISVDPERDTVEQVRDYVKEFHSDLIGLTGTADEIRQVARAYRVYYMKTEEEGSDYLVDHSIVMFLMDSNMNFTKFYGKNYDADTLAAGIIKEISRASEARETTMTHASSQNLSFVISFIIVKTFVIFYWILFVKFCQLIKYKILSSL